MPLPPGVAVAPPEAELDFSLSFSASLVAALGAEGVLGLVALGALGLEALPPTDAEPEAEPDGGVEGGVVCALGAGDEPGALDVRSWSRSPQAARPRARATATANVESLMCSPRLVVYERERPQNAGRV